MSRPTSVSLRDDPATSSTMCAHAGCGHVPRWSGLCPEHYWQMQVEALTTRVRELEEPGFHSYVGLARSFLTNYPPDLFDGSSGDPGPVFVAGLRQALAAYDAACAKRAEEKRT